MTDMHKTPPLALTLRGYIKHAPENWRAHLAAAADQIEHAATMRRTIEEMVRLSVGARQDMERLAKDAAELRDELGAMLPEIAALDRQRTDAQQVRDDAVRTMRECEARMHAAEAERYTLEAMALWVLWHHQGYNSEIGRPIRAYLGMGRGEYLTDAQLAKAKAFAAAMKVGAP